MALQMVPIHKFKAYRLRSRAATAGTAQDTITAEDLAEMLTILSGEAKLGPVVNVTGSGDPAVIVGELQGFVGIEIGAGLVAPVGMSIPPAPAGGNKGR